MKTFKSIRPLLTIQNLILLLFASLIFTACGENSIHDLEAETEAEIIENDSPLYRSSNKRNVCHNGEIKSVNINALPAHAGHGDAVDWDNDGYFSTENDCGMPVDCDDENASINPGAEEICNDEIDNNCNGLTDEGCITCLDACDETIYCEILSNTDYSITCYSYYNGGSGGNAINFDNGTKTWRVFYNYDESCYNFFEDLIIAFGLSECE